MKDKESKLIELDYVLRQLALLKESIIQGDVISINTIEDIMLKIVKKAK